MKRLVLMIACGCLGACAGPKHSLVVKQYQLREQGLDGGEEPMARMEKERRLRGAVSIEERRQRLGQYYTLLWQDSKGVGSGPVEVVFDYRQGASGSKVKQMIRTFPASAADGVAELSVLGDNYFNQGKVLAWRATLKRGDRVLATERSYLWQ